MNTRPTLRATLAGLALLLTSAAPAGSEPAGSEQAGAPALVVAVLGFGAGAPDLEPTATNLRELMTAQLMAKPGLELVERQRIDLALAELELGLSGIVDSAGAAQVGRLVGAKVLVTGRIFRMGEALHAVSRTISVETGRVFVQTAELAPGQTPSILAETLAQQIARTTAEKRAALVAGPKPAGDRLERLAELTAGRKLPTVSIDIEERHAGRATLDPAAATELGSILQQLGFRLVEPGQSAVRPEIRITGEALSERGLRKGNLVSVAGRVELKAVDLASSEVVAVLSHTERVVDLSEQVAGKTALARAAAVLSEPLVSSLVKEGSTAPASARP